MKQLKIGDTFKWIDGSNITVKDVSPPDTTNLPVYLFHEIGGMWGHENLVQIKRSMKKKVQPETSKYKSEEYRGSLSKDKTHYTISNVLGTFRREFDSNEGTWERQTKLAQLLLHFDNAVSELSDQDPDIETHYRNKADAVIDFFSELSKEPLTVHIDISRMSEEEVAVAIGRVKEKKNVERMLGEVRKIELEDRKGMRSAEQVIKEEQMRERHNDGPPFPTTFTNFEKDKSIGEIIADDTKNEISVDDGPGLVWVDTPPMRLGGDERFWEIYDSLGMTPQGKKKVAAFNHKAIEQRLNQLKKDDLELLKVWEAARESQLSPVSDDMLEVFIDRYYKQKNK